VEAAAGQAARGGLKQPPVRIEPELLRQNEGVCYDADSLTLWLTSEHLPTPLLQGEALDRCDCGWELVVRLF
jgi:hypothetical protein